MEKIYHREHKCMIGDIEYSDEAEGYFAYYYRTLEEEPVESFHASEEDAIAELENTYNQSFAKEIEEFEQLGGDGNESTTAEELEKVRGQLTAVIKTLNARKSNRIDYIQAISIFSKKLGRDEYLEKLIRLLGSLPSIACSDSKMSVYSVYEVKKIVATVRAETFPPEERDCSEEFGKIIATLKNWEEPTIVVFNVMDVFQNHLGDGAYYDEFYKKLIKLPMTMRPTVPDVIEALEEFAAERKPTTNPNQVTK